MGKEYIERDLEEREEEIGGVEYILGATQTLTLPSNTTSARLQMANQEIIQSRIPTEPEIARMTTKHEHMFAKYSGTIRETKETKTIVKKIRKHGDYVYTLITRDKDGVYDIEQRSEVKPLAEGNGYRIKNDSIDSFEEGDVIPKKTVLYHSPGTDEYGNFMYGLNAKVLYTISPETIEDAVVVSESFAKRFKVTDVERCIVTINDNDIPLNLYGGKKHYKMFPDVGEWTKKSILCGTRRRDKSFDQYNLKNSNLRKIFSSDDVYQFAGNWQIVDIDIWCNKPVDEISNLPANSQVNKYYLNQIRYWTEIYNELDKIIKSGEDYSRMLSFLYSKARDYLDPNCRYTLENRMFSNIVMEFTMAKDEPLKKGCKICGRYGNKSVISTILPDDEMGITEDGIIPEIRMDALGVLGRLNSGQCIEQELNWIANKVLKNIQAMGNPKGKPKLVNKEIKYLLDFIKKINKDQYNDMDDFIDSLTEDEREEFILDIYNEVEPIYIQQHPIFCITGDELYQLYQDYDMVKSAIYYRKANGAKIKALRKVIVADEYILRQKQEPITKFSARSSSLISPTSLTPIKSLNARKHKAIYQDQAARMGEQEMPILMLSNDSDALDYFYRAYSTSVSGRRDPTIYTQDSKDGFIINMKSYRSKVVDKLNALIGSVGFNLTIDYDNAYDEEADNIAQEESYEIDTKVPKYIKKMFDE